MINVLIFGLIYKANIIEISSRVYFFARVKVIILIYPEYLHYQ